MKELLSENVDRIISIEIERIFKKSVFKITAHGDLVKLYFVFDANHVKSIEMILFGNKLRVDEVYAGNVTPVKLNPDELLSYLRLYKALRYLGGISEYINSLIG